MDVRALVPRVRRTIEGVVPLTEGLTDGQVEQLTADAVAEVIFYSGGFWGYALNVVERDTNDAPIHWSINPDLDEATATVIAAQSALDYFFHEFKDTRTQEVITNEGSSWEYQTSANLINQQLQMLRQNRDDALKIIFAANVPLPRFVSFIRTRDAATSRILEPYLDGVGDRGEMMGQRTLDAIEQVR